MNQLLFSFLAAVTVLFHMAIHSFIKRGKVREAFCAGWCIDAVFAVCGTAVSFGLYRYDFTPFLTPQSLLWVLPFLTATLLLFLLAPSGLSLFAGQAASPDEHTTAAGDAEASAFSTQAPYKERKRHKKRSLPKEELLLSEYRFNDTLCMVRNFFLALLFALPALLAVFDKSRLKLSLLLTWSASEICGAFCFTAFLILLPISLRQAFFWQKELTGKLTEEEKQVLAQYRVRLHYRRKNRRL